MLLNKWLAKCKFKSGWEYVLGEKREYRLMKKIGEKLDFMSEVEIKPWREDLAEEELRSLATSPRVTVWKLWIEVPAIVQSGY